MADSFDYSSWLDNSYNLGSSSVTGDYSSFGTGTSGGDYLSSMFGPQSGGTTPMASGTDTGSIDINGNVVGSTGTTGTASTTSDWTKLLGASGGLMKDIYSYGQSGAIAGQAAAAADPFAQQRPQYQNMLSTLMNDPSKINLTPGAQFQMQQGLKGVESSDAAKGYLGSGNIMGDLMKYSQGTAQTDYWNQIMNLSTLSGATSGSPAAAGSAIADTYGQKFGSGGGGSSSGGSSDSTLQDIGAVAGLVAMFL